MNSGSPKPKEAEAMCGLLSSRVTEIVPVHPVDVSHEQWLSRSSLRLQITFATGNDSWGS